MNILRKIFKTTLPIFLIIAIVFLGWLLFINHEIDQRLAEGWFPPATEVYASGETLFLKAELPDKKLKELLQYSQFKPHTNAQLNIKEYKVIDRNECLFNLNGLIKVANSNHEENIDRCYILQITRSEKVLVSLSFENKIEHIFTNNKSVSQFQLPPFVVAQYYKNTPFLRSHISVGDIPLQCLQSITAIEDKNFLNHRGISLKGIARAMIKNITKASISEGASTITQQLIKNYFLTPERTFKRKFKELFMAILLEAKVSKDEILSNYLNVIYLGQSGPFQVRGYSAAARHYFQKEIQNLSLPECSLLAAIVNSPGRYNPFKNQERALSRRKKVLNHMLESKYISSLEFDEALNTPLPKKPKFVSSQFSSYFLDATQQELKVLDLDNSKGLKVFTTLSPFRQIHAQKAVSSTLKKLSTNKKRPSLQSSLINIDLQNGAIKALIGGSSFQSSPFNRALKAERQVGSLMKPFVYLAALETKDPDGHPYSALTLLPDKLTTYKYEGQSWTPKNYSRTFQEQVPLYYALKNSINAPTAHLGMNIGIESVIDVSKRLGIRSPLKAVPSLSLGSLELTQIELAQAYVNLANLGSEKKLKLITKVLNLENEVLYSTPKNTRQLISSHTSAQLINILQQTAKTGTARSLTTWRKFTHPIAGKTGTTNNTRDSWFVGFTPDTMTIVWVGNDQNKSTGLTGSSGALPVWSEYMSKVLTLFPTTNDFAWPESLASIEVSSSILSRMIPSLKDHEKQNTVLMLPNQEVQKYKKQFFLEAITPSFLRSYKKEK